MDLDQFQADYADLGIVVVEVLQSATNVDDLNDWSDALGHHLFRTAPPSQLEDDWNTGEEEAWPITIIVDSQTMEVVRHSCLDDWKEVGGTVYDGFKACFENHTDLPM